MIFRQEKEKHHQTPNNRLQNWPNQGGWQNSTTGKTHDKKDYQNQKFIIPPTLRTKGDSGYQRTSIEVLIKNKKK